MSSPTTPAPGQRLCIIGSNGTGKTPFADALAPAP